jgi:hypothetical protein
MVRVVAQLVSVLALVAVVGPVAAFADEGRHEVRATGACSGVAASKLRLKGRDDRIELRFEVAHGRPGIWRVIVVHERRVVWKSSIRVTRSGGSFEVRRMLADLPGADTVSARALGPRGVVCRAAATLAEA